MLEKYRKIGTLTGQPALGVHQDHVLSRVLLIIVFAAPSMKFHTGCPSELLYAGDLIDAESIDR